MLECFKVRELHRQSGKSRVADDLSDLSGMVKHDSRVEEFAIDMRSKTSVRVCNSISIAVDS